MSHFAAQPLPPSSYQLTRHCQKRFFNVARVFGTRFEERDVQRLREGPGFLRVHNLVCNIALISNQKLTCPFAGVTVHFAQPIIDVAKRFLARDVVHHDYPVGPSVIGTGNGSEPFLTRRIPNLQFNRLFVNFNGSEAKIDADGADVTLCEGVVGESQEEAAFPDARIADQNEFEEVVVIAFRHRRYQRVVRG
eukprot:CAMPEP_0171462820 /NCGR_PEP_ID=MMETSP0945-20130129/6706_1 /TAXON_ID=109269 /ORGANISM="Vaucheria litorea, Strain CCMP2940" /LENGTH=192 /DNA_ID=CAMNT_0011989425 /DNA_START=166 /DNA_END=745 /DNA_ORIENTATION=+